MLHVSVLSIVQDNRMENRMDLYLGNLQAIVCCPIIIIMLYQKEV